MPLVGGRLYVIYRVLQELLVGRAVLAGHKNKRISRIRARASSPRLPEAIANLLRRTPYGSGIIAIRT